MTKAWLVIALSILLPWHWWCIARDPWFHLPPKPIGDGPDYENIAYQLSRGAGWSMDWTDPQWREPYLRAQADLPIGTTAPSTSGGSAEQVEATQPVEGYAAQFQREDAWTPTTARPPLLPTVVAGVYSILGRGPSSFAMTRWLLATSLAIGGALAVAMTANLAGALSRRAGLVSLAASATLALALLDRTVRSYATDFLTEPLAWLLLQLWLWCAGEMLGVWSWETPNSANQLDWRRRSRLAVIAGGLLGLLIFTRSLMVLWLPGLWLLIAGCGWVIARQAALVQPGVVASHRPLYWDHIRLATRMLVVSWLVCLPWWLRNCWVLMVCMPLGTQGTISLIGGYSDEALAAHGQWQVAPEIRLRARLAETGKTEGLTLVEREVLVANEAAHAVRVWASQHVWQLPTLAWERVWSEWGPYTGRALLWKLAALVGLIVLARRLPAAAWLLVGVLLINSLTVMGLYSVGGRFLVPCYGILYTLGGLGVFSIGYRLIPQADL